MIATLECKFLNYLFMDTYFNLVIYIDIKTSKKVPFTFALRPFFEHRVLLRECVAVRFTLNIKHKIKLMETIHKNVYNLCSYDIEK